MGDKATLDTPLDAVIFVIPVAVVLTLLFLLWSRRRFRRGALPPQPRASSEPFHAILQPSPGTAQTEANPQIETDLPPQKATVSIDTLTSKIEAAIVNGEKTSLSSLYFDLAAAHGLDGNLTARMAALRSAAGYGALHGPQTAHAAARLALGEEAHQAGDLTSACEQWQLARTAFQEGGDAEQHARVEKRMRENGCPTDWVLTDF
ncbi:hypothetical protein [Hyphomicrobium sp.]|jgi:hypothetical protein|uniref:hypothetical protein n=1 Tax=Hyphomicrobium sp. TaxID=82 RepID=UPI00356A5BBC